MNVREKQGEKININFLFSTVQVVQSNVVWILARRDEVVN